MSLTSVPFSKRTRKKHIRVAGAPIRATNARRNFFSLIKEVGETHTPVQITGKNNSVVMVSQEDWNSIQETLYLESIPGMKASILKEMRAPASSFSKKLKW